MNYVSPSQITTFRSCPRSWYYPQVLKERPPQKKSAKLGEDIHHVLENYLEKGVAPDLSTQVGRIAHAGLKFLPEPGSAYVELDIGKHPAGEGLQLAGIRVIGRVDFVDLTKDIPEIGDHKTTSNFSYAKTPEELLWDPQMVIYGQFLIRFAEHMGEPLPARVRARHIYYLTTGQPKALEIPVEFSDSHLNKVWNGSLTETVKEMTDVYKIKKVEDVPANYSACGNYGGCFFRDRCAAMKKQQNQPKREDSPMGLLDAIRKNVPGSFTPATNVPTQQLALGVLPPDAPKNEVTPPADMQKKEEEAPKTSERKPRGSKDILLGLGWDNGQIQRMTVQETRRVLDTQLRAEGHSVLPDGRVIACTPANGPTPKNEDTPDHAIAHAREAQSAPAAQKFGDYVHSNSTLGESSEVSRKREVSQKRESSNFDRGLTLYIDCIPEKGENGQITFLEDYLAPLFAEVEALGGVRHYTLFEGGFGKGMAQVQARLKDAPPTGIVVANTRYPATSACLETLRPLAGLIVRGI